MSLARAMTKRIKRAEVPKEPTSMPTRSQSVIDRTKISLPVALVSTTNMLSYNAPDIVNMRHVSPSIASNHSSADDSDTSVSGRSRASSHGSRDTTLTDASSVDSSPTSPAPNHLSGYFASAGKQVRKSASTTSLHQVKEEIVEPIPAIPSRALSHSKRAHERLAAKRSMQNMNTRSSLNSRGSMGSQRHSREQRTSLDMFKGSIEEEAHPFGRELEQLNEIVEEFGGVVRDAETEADLLAIRSKNLATFCAADYLAEIQPLFSHRFGIPHQAAPMAWI
ncbi:Nn.00g057030.m01.CDS01 [Neocucurbitaria sp. VM-36]